MFGGRPAQELVRDAEVGDSFGRRIRALCGNQGWVRSHGIASLMEDLGLPRPKIALKLDSASAKAIAERQGCGKLRHIQIRLLWLQSEVLVGTVRMVKVAGVHNPADIATKAFCADEGARHICTLGGRFAARLDTS